MPMMDGSSHVCSSELLPPLADPRLFTFAQILQSLGDVAVEPRIAQHRIGPPRSDRRIDFVAPKREIVLVEPETVHQRHDVAITDFGAAAIIGDTIGEPGAVGDQAGPRREAIALPPCGIDLDARQAQRLIEDRMSVDEGTSVAVRVNLRGTRRLT